MPGLGRNLLSVKKITRRGGKVSFTASQAVNHDEQRDARTTASIGRTSTNWCASLAGGTVHQTQAALLTAAEEAWLWHDKVGHRNQDVQKMTSYYVTNGGICKYA